MGNLDMTICLAADDEASPVLCQVHDISTHRGNGRHKWGCHTKS